ncbi:anthranilate synthase component II [Edaphocola aurantiacus]|uniref:anthranilate synthase component II n=1 Tax=Edaphocola aurantiacus TaxID=2601682 RepID=UPI001C95F753|nr:aminodeoxychorismate/anthranilate synthase component II [Edaphocola aurantiacus]
MWLLIDNYDSFSDILADYLKQVHQNVCMIRNDELSLSEIIKLNPERIILSPGPKDPEHAGMTMSVIDYFHDKIPILGVCLGHQALAQYFGCKVTKAPFPVHGKTSQIKHNGQHIFSGLSNPLKVMRYHSLQATGMEDNPDLQILATTDEGVIMAFRHKKYSCTGVQFHPESVLTESGLNILKNWANT